MLLPPRRGWLWLGWALLTALIVSAGVLLAGVLRWADVTRLLSVGG